MVSLRHHQLKLLTTLPAVNLHEIYLSNSASQHTPLISPIRIGDSTRGISPRISELNFISISAFRQSHPGS
ncbi:Protein of unknown function [Pyronema omphalodes CBS 100304]|uniref:Uncharacterized protein n=1 Tax=Pyronema omphalodes (strain CBS 100304) TaxID=1076935 RepID=U4LB66_PYROM|nr:Protein of unknown function [Pyronema omphalodes CBS 100304]